MSNSKLQRLKPDGSTCEHPYPDVLRLRDELRPDGTIVRILDCVHCGRIERQLDANSLDKAMLAELRRTRIIGGSPESDLSAIREREHARLKADAEQVAATTLDDVLAETISTTIKVIDFYYTEEGLDVGYMLHNEPWGKLYGSPVAAKRIIEDVAARANLSATKLAGEFIWQNEGKSYHITVQAFAGDDEPTFRLTIKQQSLSTAKPRLRANLRELFGKQ